jgi:hypothetical protein
MTDAPKFPRGRPPKSKNVLLKSTMEPVKEQPPVVPTIPEVKEEPKVEVKPEVVEVKSIEVKEKKPRTEQQLLATKRMIDANKAKRKINIVESKPEPKPESKPEPKPQPKPQPNPHTTLEDKLRQMEEKLAMMEQRKQKKKKSEPAPKPVKEPKPKKMQRVESSSESEEESDDDEYVEKYKQKAERRFQAVQAIEQRLQQAKTKPRGKYDHLSLF